MPCFIVVMRQVLQEVSSYTKVLKVLPLYVLIFVLSNFVLLSCLYYLWDFAYPLVVPRT